MEVSGVVRECTVFGENLVLKRTIKTQLFSDSFTLEDTIVNEGFNDENVVLGYHCNFGYPLVCEGAEIINVPRNVGDITEPVHGIEEDCIGVEMSGDIVTTGVKNNTTGVYLTYNAQALPDFLIWKMLGESEYVVGLEPRTTNFGGEDIGENNAYVVLQPFEEHKTYLKFEFKNEIK